MEQEPKLRIKEAENVIDSPVNKERILERLSAMSEDIIYVKKEIENGGKNEDQKKDVVLEEEMGKRNQTMRNEE